MHAYTADESFGGGGGLSLYDPHGKWDALFRYACKRGAAENDLAGGGFFWRRSADLLRHECKRPTGVLLYIEKIHAILQVWNQSTRKFI